MTCRRIELGGGTAVWTYHRPPAQPACSACSRPGGVLTCQFELGGAKAGQRCGKALCRRCAGQGEPALCPPHQKLVAARAAAPGGAQP